LHAGNTAAAPVSEVDAIIRSPTNMAAADGGVISRYASHCYVTVSNHAHPMTSSDVDSVRSSQNFSVADTHRDLDFVICMKVQTVIDVDLLSHAQS